MAKDFQKFENFRQICPTLIVYLSFLSTQWQI